MNHKEKQHLSGEHADSYDAVPDYVFKDGGSIFDVGCMSGINAILSRHRHYFVEAEAKGLYQGVDIQEYPKYYFSPIETSDLLDYETGRQFDLVIALHTIEHIPIEYWPRVFAKLKCLVADGGYLVVATPHKEAAEGGTTSHLVFDIQEDTLRGFLEENVTIKKRRRPYRYFRDYGEGILRPLFRFVWRILTRHPFRYGARYGPEIMAIWRKEGEE